MQCPVCSMLCQDQDRFCSHCGYALTASAAGTGKRRITLGGYETAPYQNEPPAPLPEKVDETDLILDRDAPGADSSLFAFSALDQKPHQLHLLLAALLIAIGVISYLGVRQVSAQRSDQSQVLAQQAAAQQAADEKARQESYRRLYREYLIVAEAQGGAFYDTLEGLGRLQSKRWLNHVFMGGVFESMMDRFTKSDPYNTMEKRGDNLSERFRDLSGAPDGLAVLYEKAVPVDALAKSIRQEFTVPLDETAVPRITLLLQEYEETLEQAQKAEKSR